MSGKPSATGLPKAARNNASATTSSAAAAGAAAGPRTDGDDLKFASLLGVLVAFPSREESEAFEPLASELSPALLPVNGLPLVDYAIEFMQRNGGWLLLQRTGVWCWVSCTFREAATARLPWGRLPRRLFLFGETLPTDKPAADQGA
ncbi:hypothetical protein cyc_07770 [Cyclospora cayetanensis]|uniref:Uncharacterized protein n=1 Tax=Cyclospora cayetanensis TaxID=88456 RepID=A0A1D3CTR1_9EIME|nr:hypothetical protein cyc_07770 [Cyclospora cayetanensis]